jgi:anti-anti-sigma factor
LTFSLRSNLQLSRLSSQQKQKGSHARCLAFWGIFMLEVEAERLGVVTILHFRGRIVKGMAVTTLRDAVCAQIHAETVVLNLAHVDLIDAGGVGVLLELRQWTQLNGIEFKLMNVNAHVQYVLEITCLDSVFEITSQDMVLTAATDPTSLIVFAILD